ncbi:hypothetical protein Tco_1474416 [Tanacetum coccineum]
MGDQFLLKMTYFTTLVQIAVLSLMRLSFIGFEGFLGFGEICGLLHRVHFPSLLCLSLDSPLQPYAIYSFGFIRTLLLHMDNQLSTVLPMLCYVIVFDTKPSYSSLRETKSLQTVLLLVCTCGILVRFEEVPDLPVVHTMFPVPLAYHMPQGAPESFGSLELDAWQGHREELLVCYAGYWQSRELAAQLWSLGFVEVSGLLAGCVFSGVFWENFAFG